MEDVLTVKEKNVMEIITKVYRQQKNHFENDNPRESIPDRIVSISKPYVRPIVRGKPTGTSAKRWASRPHLSIVAVQLQRIRRRTMSGRSWPGSGPQRWKARSERRRNTTP